MRKRYSPYKELLRIFVDDLGMEKVCRIVVDMENVCGIEEYVDEEFSSFGNRDVTMIRTYTGGVYLVKANFDDLLGMMNEARDQMKSENITFNRN